MDGISENFVTQVDERAGEKEAEPMDSQELLSIFMKSYEQLTALKHIIYSSVHLSDDESLAELLSKQIDERMSAQRNAVWLLRNGEEVAEIARNGKSLGKDERRSLKIESSKALKRLIQDQLVVWPSGQDSIKEMLEEFETPVLFPVKGQPEPFGFLVIDPEESAEIEVYQFVCHFAAMTQGIVAK